MSPIETCGNCIEYIPDADPDDAGSCSIPDDRFDFVDSAQSICKHTPSRWRPSLTPLPILDYACPYCVGVSGGPIQLSHRVTHLTCGWCHREFPLQPGGWNPVRHFAHPPEEQGHGPDANHT